MRKASLLTILFLGLAFICQSQVPHLSGKIEISIQKGTFDADLKLSRLPQLNDYSIWLHTGMNVEYFRAVNDKFNYGFNLEYNQEQSEEAFQYYFPANDNQGRFLPDAFLIKYTGKFPVIRDTLRASDWSDWKGNMAFNGKTLRASEQTAWYPILYNRKEDVQINAYTFEIELVCKDCKTLYMNGDLPKKAKKATFASQLAVPLLLFVGNYEFSKIDDVYLLNADLKPAAQSTLSKTTAQIIQFYEDKLKIPYGKSVVYISTTPVSKRNEWMFVTYPTITVVGIKDYKLDSYFDEETFEFKRKSNITFIAHELGHYYLGTQFVPNSTLRWFFLEGLTDYLSIQAARELLGAEIYQKILANYIGEVADYQVKPLSQIILASEIDETYRYRYVPLLLTAIEREIGIDRMWIWVQKLIQSKPTNSDFAFFQASLQAAEIDQNTLDRIAKTYIDAPEAKENVLEKIQE